MKSTFMAISFVGPEAFARALGADGAGVFVTQVVPFPYDSASMPLVAEYQAALTASDPAATPSFVSLEGYVVGRLVVMALKRIDGPITRTALLQSIFGSGSFNLGGMELSFSAENNQGSNRVFLTEIGDHGSFTAVESLKRPETAAGNLVPTMQ
jgi:ABC-type branched-subunit amino acid transport system substrate-binding protein